MTVAGTNRFEKLKASLLMGMIAWLSTLFLTAAETNSFYPIKRGRAREPLRFSGPKSKVGLPGPDQLEGPAPSLLDSLKPKTSFDDDPFTSLPASRGPVKSKDAGNDQKNLFMETPGPLKDNDVNKLFGIRDEAEEIENGPRRARSEKRDDPNDPRSSGREPNSSDAVMDGSENEKRTRLARAADSKEESRNRKEPDLKNFFGSSVAANEEALELSRALGSAPLSLRDLLNSGSSAAVDRQNQLRRDEFRQLLGIQTDAPAGGIFDSINPQFDATGQKVNPALGSGLNFLDRERRLSGSASDDALGAGTRVRESI
ncbi:MAG TPA: hypothetical protein VFA77_17555, partial [Candidatus Eisenbacteria bacterium]|nr:hypothetical protein [Candidatus Eisenbacteria bacterium]